MDNLKFIDTNTWEVIDEPNNLIHVDKDIAETIAILNKKGYKTKASCSGHPKIELTLLLNKREKLKNYFYPIEVEYIKELDKVLFYSLVEKVDTYIMFEEVYHFDVLPKGFKYEHQKIENNIVYKNDKKIGILKSESIENKENCTIRKYTKVLNKEKKLYDYKTMCTKLKKTNEELLKWAKELKSLNV